MKIHTVDQKSEAWHKLRLGRFGSTDANTVSVAGAGLKTLCYQKASEIMIGRIPETYTNADMERGIAFEPTARIAYKIQQGVEVQEVGYVTLDEWVGASPDGVVEDEGLIEIKCPNDYKFVKFLHEKKAKGIKAIEKAHYLQMQHQIYVMDRKWCDYVIFNDNIDRIEITRVERDDEVIQKIVTGLEKGVKQIKEILEAVK